MIKHTPATPQQIAQKVKAGRGWLIVRNSGTLADTDYERVADEIVDALNKRRAYPALVEALRLASERLRGAAYDLQVHETTNGNPLPKGEHRYATVRDELRADHYRDDADAHDALLRELGEDRSIE